MSNLSSKSIRYSEDGMKAQQATNLALQTGIYQGKPEAARIRRDRRLGPDTARGEEARSSQEPGGLKRVLVKRTRRRSQKPREDRFNRTATERRQALDLAFSDTSRELQTRFLQNHPPPTQPWSQQGRMFWMRDNLKTMLGYQLGQWTGDAPYQRSEYRLMLQALDGGRPETLEEPVSTLSGRALDRAIDRADRTLQAVEGHEHLGTQLSLVA